MFYYHVDLRAELARDQDPVYLLSLIKRLPAESMTYSLMRDEEKWRDFLGKGPEWYLLADVFDAINQNTRATGQWKKKAPKFEPYPRPGVKKATSVKGFLKTLGGIGKH